MFEKYIKDGKVAVLYSPGYGAGWSTWNEDFEKELIFDKEIVALVLENKMSALEKVATSKYKECYLGGLDQLTVKWLPIGTAFTIEEYDGSESIQIVDEITYIVA